MGGIDIEGVQVARWLNKRGISAFVLKYRLGLRYSHPAMLEDGLRAVRWVRYHAAELGIDKSRIGVWGFSAGGHLASMVATQDKNLRTSPATDSVDEESAKPDFCILAYPVITLEEEHTHMPSREALLGLTPSRELVTQLSSEKRVNAATPPAFIFATEDDDVVPVQNSKLFSEACGAHGVRCDINLFPHGPHGVGLALDSPELRTWTVKLENWLRVLGLPLELNVDSIGSETSALLDSVDKK